MADFRSPGQILDAKQWRFLRATSEVVPEVWEALRVQVAPAYALALKSVSTPRLAHGRDALGLRGVYVLSLLINERTTPEIVALVKVLSEWQATWNLTPAWCERYALATLYAHRRRGYYRRPYLWLWRRPKVKLSYWAKLPPPPPGVVRASLGSPYIDPRPRFKRPSTPKEFKDANEHRKRVGWEAFNEPNARHLRWLALYQCRGESARAVGWEYEWECSEPPTEETIYKAVKRCAWIIQLPLRPRRS